MSTLTIEGWCKPATGRPLIPLELIRFHIGAGCRRALDAAEAELQRTHAREKFVDVDPRDLDLRLPEECGPLRDCRLRVYLGGMDQARGQFHLVAHRASDDSLVYSNAVMVDQLLADED